MESYQIINNEIFIKLDEAKFFMTPAEIHDKEVQGKFIYLNNLPKLKPQIPTTENTLFGKVININK
jgi:hypothetical protein